jgi:hypothetical protein
MAGMMEAVVEQMLADFGNADKIWLQPVSFPNPENQFSYFAATPGSADEIVCLRHGSAGCVVEKLGAELLQELKAADKPPAILVNSDLQALKDIQDDAAREKLQTALGVAEVKDDFDPDASRALFKIAEKDISKFFGGFETVDDQLEAVAQHLKDGADPNWHDEDGSVLTRVAFNTHVEFAEALLATGKVDVNFTTQYLKTTALLESCRVSGDRSLELLRLLLKAGADATVANSNKENGLHLLASERSSDPVSVQKAWLLLEAGCQIDAKNYKDATPLEMAEEAST